MDQGKASNSCASRYLVLIIISSPRPGQQERGWPNLGSGVEKRVGAMMSAEEAEEVDHIILLSTLVAVSGP
jgi:hypothetical protein